MLLGYDGTCTGAGSGTIDFFRVVLQEIAGYRVQVDMQRQCADFNSNIHNDQTISAR
jgi:hypothetical protein